MKKDVEKYERERKTMIRYEVYFDESGNSNEHRSGELFIIAGFTYRIDGGIIAKEELKE